MTFGIIEYPDRPEPSLLVCAGTGLMLSLMDQCPRFRWCVDADAMSADQQVAFGEWLNVRSRSLHVLGFAGWYCSTNPERIANALRKSWGRCVAVYAQCHGPSSDGAFDDMWTAFDLKQFVRQVNAFPPADAVDVAIATSPVPARRLSLAEYLARG